MTRNGRQPVLVVVQLTGGNDFMNTVVPYTSPHYYDARQKITVPEDEALPIDGGLGFHPSAAPLKEMYDQGAVAVVQGVGHIGASRSHFRAMDVWHTCEPVQIGSEGWLGRAIREIDPGKENVLTGVNIGRGLPRAMVAPGVPVSSVGDPRQLRHPDRRNRHGPARAGPRDVQGNVRARHRHGPRDGLPVADGPERAQGRGHPQDRARQVCLRGRVRGHVDRAQPEGRGESPSGRARHPHLLHQPRRLRHARQPAQGPSGAAGGPLGRDRRLLPGPPRPRRVGGGRDADLHGVRPQDAGQRQRHGSRSRRGRLHRRGRSRWRALRRVPVAGTPGLGRAARI